MLTSNLRAALLFYISKHSRKSVAYISFFLSYLPTKVMKIMQLFLHEILTEKSVWGLYTFQKNDVYPSQGKFEPLRTHAPQHFIFAVAEEQLSLLFESWLVFMYCSSPYSALLLDRVALLACVIRSTIPLSFQTGPHQLRNQF